MIDVKPSNIIFKNEFADAYSYVMNEIIKDVESQRRDKEYGLGAIDRVIAHDPATIIYWKDGTKTVVKCMPGDEYDVEKGIAMAVIKHLLGNKYVTFKKFLQSESEKYKNEE